ncbi:MAG: MBL fold metallo-hydrolase [Desulfobulbaceae bacterium]|nr:MBL fold metallo-hydrolase [Desulfobulbaceae bacterium]
MGITFDILGAPGRDNALLVRIDSGQSIERLLFDCGDGCLNGLSFSEISAIDYLLFSHLHMDHIGGFDNYFRCVFNRKNKPNHIWGPSGTGRIIQHRFQGFLWNLNTKMSGTWRVTDIEKEGTSTIRLELAEAFAKIHIEECTVKQHLLIDRPKYVIEAYVMNHRTPSIAYVVREKTRRNIDTDRLEQMGLSPGPWINQVKNSSDLTENVLINGVSHSMATLQEALLVETKGDSIAYLTDFLLDDKTIAELAVILRGCKTVICEGQYRHSDLDLAHKNFHMTTVLSAQLASQAEVGNLILFHLSDRYRRKEWIEMLLEARELFPATHYPPSWQLEPLNQ